jgi:hypothetical protein
MPESFFLKTTVYQKTSWEICFVVNPEATISSKQIEQLAFTELLTVKVILPIYFFELLRRWQKRSSS